MAAKHFFMHLPSSAKVSQKPLEAAPPLQTPPAVPQVEVAAFPLFTFSLFPTASPPGGVSFVVFCLFGACAYVLLVISSAILEQRTGPRALSNAE